MGLEGTEVGARQQVDVGAVANILGDVRGVFCLFVVLIFGPNDTPLT